MFLILFFKINDHYFFNLCFIFFKKKKSRQKSMAQYKSRRSTVSALNDDMMYHLCLDLNECSIVVMFFDNSFSSLFFKPSILIFTISWDLFRERKELFHDQWSDSVCSNTILVYYNCKVCGQYICKSAICVLGGEYILFIYKIKEPVELHFSIYSKKLDRFLTESFVVRVSAEGKLPNKYLDRKTLFWVKFFTMFLLNVSLYFF